MRFAYNFNVNDTQLGFIFLYFRYITYFGFGPNPLEPILRLRDYPRKSIQQNERELICDSFPRDTKD